ncbi:hypothetical protein VTK56DRAFT_4507 [Thermocarpiscus australiensis]
MTITVREAFYDQDATAAPILITAWLLTSLHMTQCHSDKGGTLFLLSFLHSHFHLVCQRYLSRSFFLTISSAMTSPEMAWQWRMKRLDFSFLLGDKGRSWAFSYGWVAVHHGEGFLSLSFHSFGCGGENALLCCAQGLGVWVEWALVGGQPGQAEGSEFSVGRSVVI